MLKKQLERAKGFHLCPSFSSSYIYSEHCGKFQLCFLNYLRPLGLRKEAASCNDEIGWVEPILANCSYAVTWIGHEPCPLQVFIVSGYVGEGLGIDRRIRREEAIRMADFLTLTLYVSFPTSESSLRLRPDHTSCSISPPPHVTLFSTSLPTLWFGYFVKDASMESVWGGLFAGLKRILILRFLHAWRRFALAAFLSGERCCELILAWW